MITVTFGGAVSRYCRAGVLPVLVAGAALLLGSGTAAANPDTAGWRHIDPKGNHNGSLYNDSNPTTLADQAEARRQARENAGERMQSNQPKGTGSGTSAGWSVSPRPDGEGWVVCKPLARFC
ncbi:hypothetical protein [Nocardia mangyaensis]|uniref:hypothetical protein n=1 Tax=Nocardia mangyaensis TaxID=2213200 RepID=UPI0026774F78|nr:hypothetical protein [Nocardia mangyaensis]MDO3648185.1 hypothetical protein [Nocardia mangyaensis]